VDLHYWVWETPFWQRHGIGSAIARALLARYEGFHQHVLIADDKAATFYQKIGFVKATGTQPMWIYAGKDHEGAS
jgi:GNAT superfamily N-acetyltransferase